MTNMARARRPKEMPIQIGVMLRVYLRCGGGIVESVGISGGRAVVARVVFVGEVERDL